MATDKYLAKRTKRNKKRRVLKMHNSAVKRADNAEHKLKMTAKDAVKKLRDDVYAFIVQKDNFRSFLVSVRDGINDLKQTDDPKYDGLIASVYDKALEKIKTDIEPEISEVAKMMDGGGNPDDKVSDFLDISSKFQNVSFNFMTLVNSVNKYHNHNVSVYHGAEVTDGITEVDDADFDFGGSDDLPEGMPDIDKLVKDAEEGKLDEEALNKMLAEARGEEVAPAEPSSEGAANDTPAETTEGEVAAESNPETTQEDPNWTDGVIPSAAVAEAMLATEAAKAAEEVVAAEAALTGDVPNVMHDVEASVVVTDE
jgi:hypothetical protein